MSGIVSPVLLINPIPVLLLLERIPVLLDDDRLIPVLLLLLLRIRLIPVELDLKLRVDAECVSFHSTPNPTPNPILAAMVNKATPTTTFVMKVHFRGVLFTAL